MSQSLFLSVLTYEDILTDEECMELYLSGEIKGFNDLYSRYSKRVESYLGKRVFNKDQVQDISQQVFMKFHNSRGSFKSGEKFAPWFFTICHSVMIDYFRKQKIQYQELDFEIKDQETKEFQIEELKNDLNESEYELIYEKFIEGRSYKELREILNTPEATLRKRVSRILAKLKKSAYE